MKVALATTLTGLAENKRIEEEVSNMGHEFELRSLKDFGFLIKNGGFSLNGGDIEADVLIVRGIFNSIKPIAIYIEHLRASGVRVFDNNISSQQYSINKIADIVKLGVSGVPVPDTFYGRSFDDYLNIAKDIGFPLVVKSTRMGKGAGVYKVEGESGLVELLESLGEEGKEGKGYVMQKYVNYEHDLRVLVIGGRMYAMKRIPGEGEFRANFSLGGSVEEYGLDGETEQLARKALDAVGMPVGGVDILIDKDGSKCVLEVNHVAGMVGMELALGENIVKKYVEFALGEAK